MQHNHIFLRSMLTQLLEEGPDSSPFLPGALSAAEEYAAGVNGRVLPQDVEKVRWDQCQGESACFVLDIGGIRAGGDTAEWIHKMA